jgi:hypothetical protein
MDPTAAERRAIPQYLKTILLIRYHLRKSFLPSPDPSVASHASSGWSPNSTWTISRGSPLDVVKPLPRLNSDG